MFRLLLVIAIVAIGNLSAANLSGKWIGTMETNGSRVRLFITLLQLGQEVSGSVATGDETKDMPIEKAEVHGDQLTFEVHDSTNRLVTFRLALADGLISGETRMGDQVSKVTLSPVRSNRVYTVVGRADSAPVLLHKVEPEYTEEARAAKFQGAVLLEVEIEPNGRVSREHVRVARGLGIELDEKAIEAVRQWTFKPAYKDRQPVAATVMIEVNFRL